MKTIKNCNTNRENAGKKLTLGPTCRAEKIGIINEGRDQISSFLQYTKFSTYR